MAKTLGATINEALRVIGEPDITAFTSANQLQNLLIDSANEAVHDLLEAARYRWGLSRDAFQTHAKLTTQKVTVFNGLTTVYSADADGNATANNFTNVAAGDFIRFGTDLVSYEVASVNTGVSPDQLTLADPYQGTSAASGTSYVVLRDVYPLSISGLDEIMIVSYGNNSAFTGSDEIQLTNIQNITERAGGDLHRNTSGKPGWMAQIEPDSSDNPQWLLWPYPSDVYHIEIWHTIKYTSNSTFSTQTFEGRAPDIAYDAVSHRVRERACMFDENMSQAQYWGQQYERARFQLVSRENRAHRDDQNMSGLNG